MSDVPQQEDMEQVIKVLVDQRNGMLDQITNLQVQIAKMMPFMPKEKKDDDKLK